VETAECISGSLADMDRNDICLLAGAREALEVVAAVRDYLAVWPSERVARVQRVDAGWAPFDQNQQPTAVYRATDVHRVCDALHGQCAALRDAGMVLTPELLELELFFLLATAKLAQLEPEPAPARAPQPSSRRDVAASSSVLRGSGHLA
jgi:hypothetical protein